MSKSTAISLASYALVFTLGVMVTLLCQRVHANLQLTICDQYAFEKQSDHCKALWELYQRHQ